MISAVVVFKVALAAATVVLLASQAAPVVPALAPLHLWAVRRSGRAGRILWPLAAGFGAAAATWAFVYRLAGEPQPAIWLVPSVGGVAGFLLLRLLRHG
jgi:hypothetical protein